MIKFRPRNGKAYFLGKIKQKYVINLSFTEFALRAVKIKVLMAYLIQTQKILNNAKTYSMKISLVDYVFTNFCNKFSTES